MKLNVIRNFYFSFLLFFCLLVVIEVLLLALCSCTNTKLLLVFAFSGRIGLKAQYQAMHIIQKNCNIFTK